MFPNSDPANFYTLDATEHEAILQFGPVQAVFTDHNALRQFAAHLISAADLLENSK